MQPYRNYASNSRDDQRQIGRRLSLVARDPVRGTRSPHHEALVRNKRDVHRAGHRPPGGRTNSTRPRRLPGRCHRDHREARATSAARRFGVSVSTNLIANKVRPSSINSTANASGRDNRDGRGVGHPSPACRWGGTLGSLGGPGRSGAFGGAGAGSGSYHRHSEATVVQL